MTYKARNVGGVTFYEAEKHHDHDIPMTIGKSPATILVLVIRAKKIITNHEQRISLNDRLIKKCIEIYEAVSKGAVLYRVERRASIVAL